MAFCQNCGSELSDGAKFCANCGTPVGVIPPTGNENRRKQEFVGAIKKCPSCGAEIPSFSAICPSCGHEIAGIKESEALKKFQEGMTELEGKEQADFIASFPIPNTREDIGNFLIFIFSILKSEIDKDADDDRLFALKAKYDEIIEKMNLLLPENDVLHDTAMDFKEKLEPAIKARNERIHARDKKIIKQRKEANKFKNRHPILHKLIIGIIIVNVLFALECIREDLKEKSHKGNTTTVSKENIFIPGEYQPYFEVTSDGEVITYDGNPRDFQISFKLKCKKQLPQDLTKGSFHINGEYMSWDTERILKGTLTSAKSGDIFNVIIDEDTYPSDIKKFDNAKQIVLTFNAEKKEQN